MREIKVMGVTIGYVEEISIKQFPLMRYAAYSAFNKTNQTDSIWPSLKGAKDQLLTLAIRSGAFTAQHETADVPSFISCELEPQVLDLDGRPS